MKIVDVAVMQSKAISLDGYKLENRLNAGEKSPAFKNKRKELSCLSSFPERRRYVKTYNLILEVGYDRFLKFFDVINLI